MAFGNGDEVLVKINGDSKGGVNAVQQQTQSLNDITNTMRTVSQMAQQMGAAAAQSGQAWLNAAKNADDYRNRLDYLRAQLSYFNETQRQSGEGAQGLQFSLGSLGQQIFQNMGTFGAFAITANSVLGVVGEIGGAVTGLIDTFVNFGETIANVVVGALEQAGQAIEGLLQQVFELNKSTEQNTGAWRFIYGGQAQATDLMNWTSSFSMHVPYTRQDLMGAITALGRAGFTEDQVKQYMSDIADMGTLNPQRNLTGAAWSIQGAMHGYSRMLKYDYGISPQDLEKFGYDQSNAEQTLMPALHQYLMSRGLLGASDWASTHTFWGAESSFVDRLQNFGLEVGGTNLAGTVDKGSMFGVMKQDLTDLSKWWDSHGKDIAKIADLFKNILGGGMKDLTAGFQGLADGLHKSGLDKLLTDILGGFGRWLNDPNTQANMKRFGDAFGQLGGTAISTTIQALGSFFQGLSSTGVPQALFNGLINLFNNIGTFFKDHKKDIDDFFYQLGKVSGKAFQDMGQGFKDIGAAFERMKANMTPQDWANLKWFISDNTIGIIGRLGVVFKTLADVLAGILITLTGIEKAWAWLEQHGWIPSGAWATGAAGAGGGGGGGSEHGSGAGSDPGNGIKQSYMPGNYTANSSTQLHFYGATMPVVTSAVQRILDVADRASYLARRTPGGLNTLGILG